MEINLKITYRVNDSEIYAEASSIKLEELEDARKIIVKNIQFAGKDLFKKAKGEVTTVVQPQPMNTTITEKQAKWMETYMGFTPDPRMTVQEAKEIIRQFKEQNGWKM